MGLLDKIEKKKKKLTTKVTVLVPCSLHADVSQILADRQISWQKAMMAAIEQIKLEAKHKG